MKIFGWPPFGHESIGHEPLTALEQWKASRHRLLWLVVSNRDVVNRDTPKYLMFLYLFLLYLIYF